MCLTQQKKGLEATWEQPYEFLQYDNNQGEQEFDEGAYPYIIQEVNGKIWKRLCKELQTFQALKGL